MASEIIERLQAVATIEEIDRELETLNEQKRTIENEADALLELRKVITVAKEGKPARKARVVRAASPVTAKTRADLVPSSAKGPTDKPHSEEDCKVWRDGSIALSVRVRAFLKLGPATVAEISRALTVIYGTVYSHLKNSKDITKTGDFYSLRSVD